MLARAAGADEVILYAQQDFEVETKRLTMGRGSRNLRRCRKNHVR